MTPEITLLELQEELTDRFPFLAELEEIEYLKAVHQLALAYADRMLERLENLGDSPIREEIPDVTNRPEGA